MVDNRRRYILLRFCLVLSITILSTLGSTGFAQPSTPLFKVVLDAGHGGKDPGKISKGVKEKDIALAIVLLVGKELKKYKTISVVYTRKKDVFVDLFLRGKIANKAKADLFVSIHCNAHSSSAYGTETYVLGLNTNRQNFQVAKAENKVIYLEDNYQKKYEGYDINSPESVIGITISQEEFLRQSVELASYVQNSFSKKMNRYNRGVKQAGFIVLHQTFMPSILIETGFITNKSERNYLKSKRGKQQISKSIANAIVEYKNKHGYSIHKEGINKSNRIYYKVQIMSSSKRVPLNPERFNGLSNISLDKSSTVYRYYYGKSENYQEALSLKKTAIFKKFKDSFIVAYNGRNRISVKKANELLK